VVLAVLTAVIPSLFTGQWYQWLHTAITFLVISCPCALVISVPLAFFSGIGAASKLGILFKGGLAIEALRKTKAVVMDKTGTLTKGTFAVNEIVCADSISEDMMLQLAASCESISTHPVASSIVEDALARGIELKHASSSSEFAGMGMKATFPEGIILCGNISLMNKYAVPTPDIAIGEGNTLVIVAIDYKYAGHFIISDAVKDDAVDAISQLVSAGLTPAMLTGDAAGSASKIASEIGIQRVHAQLLPQDKLDTLNSLRDELGPVMFVGDGINDAPVLAGADVGAAMGSGADAAIEAADVVFMNSSVSAIPQSIDIADATGRIATQNIVFALAIKFLVIVMGFAGFANIWAAVFADTGVAMLCILNSLRLLWKKF
jgi:Cd2+/Zn2+-exporting ATPase